MFLTRDPNRMSNIERSQPCSSNKMVSSFYTTKYAQSSASVYFCMYTYQCFGFLIMLTLLNKLIELLIKGTYSLRSLRFTESDKL